MYVSLLKSDTDFNLDSGDGIRAGNNQIETLSAFIRHRLINDGSEEKRRNERENR